MGWRAFRRWLAQARAERERDDGPTSPDTWAGSERDPFWRQR